MYKHVRLFALFQLILMFFINVGISVYAHTCLSSGEQTILFSLNDDPCSAKEEVVEVEKDGCCSKESEIVSHQEGNCCDIEQKILKADDSYIHVWFDDLVQLGHCFLITQPLAKSFNSDDITISSTLKVGFRSNAPPIFQGRSIHLVNSVFTI